MRSEQAPVDCKLECADRGGKDVTASTRKPWKPSSNPTNPNNPSKLLSFLCVDNYRNTYPVYNRVLCCYLRERLNAG